MRNAAWRTGLFCLLLTFFSPLFLFAQTSTNPWQAKYATGGTGASINKICWLTWGTSGGTIANGTYYWKLTPTISAVATITGLTSSKNSTTPLIAYNTGNYSGDGLNLLFSGVNPVGLANRVSTDKVTFNINIQLFLNGVQITYPGMVMADAESMASGEFFQATTNGAGWRLIDLRDNSVLLNGTDYKLTVSDLGKTAYVANGVLSNIKVQGVFYTNGATDLTNVQIQGNNTSAMAIGFIVPFDFGDAPATYGSAGHYINNLTATGSTQAVGIWSINGMAISTLTPSSNVYMGAANVDADANPPVSAGADYDNLNGVNDEDGVTFTGGSLKVNQSGNYIVTVKATNKNTTKAANLYGWIDFNGDGVFAANEIATGAVPANTTTATNYTLTFNLDNYKFASNTFKPGSTYARFRITTDNLTNSSASPAADMRSATAAADGEAEDYAVTITSITVSGTIYNDKNGITDNLINGTAKGTIDGTQLYAYLSLAGTIVAKATVAAAGTYSFSVANPSSVYVVAISTDGTKVVGNALSTLSSSLPTGWVYTGTNYGAYNMNGTGIAASPYNGQLSVSIGTSSNDVTGADFGLEKLPVNNTSTFSITTPATNSTLALTTANSLGELSATDAEDGTLGSGKSLKIISLAAMNGNKLLYNGTALAEGDVINNYTPTLLRMQFAGKLSLSAAFTYSFVDAAGQIATTPGSFKIVWVKPLPLDLLSFAVKEDRNNVVLTWQTANEINVESFDVEYSADGSSWSKKQTVLSSGRGGDVYTASLPRPSTEKNYYRLKMIDKDADFKYSPVKVITFSTTTFLNVYPNPSDGKIYINTNGTATVKEIEVYDMKGSIKAVLKNIVANEINVSTLASGQYILQIELDNGDLLSRKIIRK